MWQVVSGTANLLSSCDAQAIARTITGGGQSVTSAAALIAHASW